MLDNGKRSGQLFIDHVSGYRASHILNNTQYLGYDALSTVSVSSRYIWAMMKFGVRCMACRSRGSQGIWRQTGILGNECGRLCRRENKNISYFHGFCMPRKLVWNLLTEKFTCVTRQISDDLNWEGNIHEFNKQGRIVIILKLGNYVTWIPGQFYNS